MLLPVEKAEAEPNTVNEASYNADSNSPIELSLKDAIAKALANSPEIRVISYDPEIAEQTYIQNQAEFDPALFGRINYAYDDKPTSSPSEIGLREQGLFESGVRTRDVHGAEWSASYLLTHTYDDLASRNPDRRYEPVLAFQVRQPLLRDFGKDTVLSGVNISRLEHQVALMSFRQRAEELAAGVISAYWQYYLAEREVTIFENWLTMAKDTLDKVEGRSGIDATDVQIKQALSSVWTREAALIQSRRRAQDARDTLTRLLADVKLNLLSENRIELVSTPAEEPRQLDKKDLLGKATQYNPRLAQARLAIDIADINIKVAKNQRMPKLDLVASAGTQTLDRSYAEAHTGIFDMDYYSATLGLNIEYPFYNRNRKAEYTKRLIERRKAVSSLQNLADQIAEQAMLSIRRAEISYREIEIQEQATQAARTHLAALEETEEIRERLTPEYLLVKLQAQDTYSNAQREHLRAILEYNVALSQVAQVTGTLLNMHKM
jgi:outer membrane protein TolC